MQMRTPPSAFAGPKAWGCARTCLVVGDKLRDGSNFVLQNGRGIDRGFQHQNADIRHLERGRHGWICLDKTLANVLAEWRYVSEILSQDFTPEVGTRAAIERAFEAHRPGVTTLAIDK